MAQLTGIAYIMVDADLLQSLPGAKMTLGGYARKPVKGHALYGYVESVMEATLECTIAHSGATPLETLRNITAGTITFQTDTGVTWTIPGAVCQDPPEITDGEGEVALKFFGDAAIQQ